LARFSAFACPLSFKAQRFYALLSEVMLVVAWLIEPLVTGGSLDTFFVKH
jgi:hypothetical protein